jgi:hypothetical protein
MSDLFENRNVHRGGGSYTSQKTTSTDQPATLENYAEYVGLPVALLKSLERNSAGARLYEAIP